MKRFFRLLIPLLIAALLSGCSLLSDYDLIPESIFSSDEDSSSDRDSSDRDSSDRNSSDSDSSDSDLFRSDRFPFGTTLPGTAAPDESGPETPVVMASEPPLDEWTLKQPIPDFLNEEQRQLFLHAYCAASNIFLGGSPSLDSFPLMDGSQPDVYPYETVEIGGLPYTLAHGRYQRWEDFQAMMDGLFTTEYQRELIGAGSEYGPTFRSTDDGQLCYLEGGRGSDIFYDGIDTDTYELVSQTGDELCFDLIGHYTEWDYDPETEQEITGESYTQRYPIRMVRTAQGWRVAEIHVPW